MVFCSDVNGYLVWRLISKLAAPILSQDFTDAHQAYRRELEGMCGLYVYKSTVIHSDFIRLHAQPTGMLQVRVIITSSPTGAYPRGHSTQRPPPQCRTHRTNAGSQDFCSGEGDLPSTPLPFVFLLYPTYSFPFLVPTPCPQIQLEVWEKAVTPRRAPGRSRRSPGRLHCKRIMTHLRLSKHILWQKSQHTGPWS